MTSPVEVRAAVCQLKGFDLHGPKTITEDFVEQVRAAHAWSTTRTGRWRMFSRSTLYGLRHLCEYDAGRGITDKAFATAATLAGWQVHRDWLPPHVLRFKRAKAEA